MALSESLCRHSPYTEIQYVATQANSGAKDLSLQQSGVFQTCLQASSIQAFSALLDGAQMAQMCLCSVLPTLTNVAHIKHTFFGYVLP